MKLRKFFCILIFVYVVCIISNVRASADIEPPKVDYSSIKISQKSATLNDTITISAKVTDDKNGVQSVSFAYQMPITKNNKYIYLKYDNNTGLYTATFKIDNTYEAGIWKLNCINVSDGTNSEMIYNSDVHPNWGKTNLTMVDFTISGTSADIEPPKVDYSSIKISQKSATLNDTITISAKVTDDKNGVQSVRFVYQMPITKNNKYIYLKYDNNTGLYTATFKIDNTYEAGIWKLNCIDVSDGTNSEMIYNSDVHPNWGKTNLTMVDFTISGTSADIEPPKVDYSSIKISQKSATLNDTITVSAKVTDNKNGVQSVSFVYQMPITKNNKYIYLKYDNNTGLYTATFEIDNTYEVGIWKLDHISVSDGANSETIYNSELWSYGNLTDLSTMDFTIKEVDKEYEAIRGINKVTVIKNSTTISNKKIDGDLYIGEKAIVTLNNVEVTGNIYVLGAGNFISIKTNEIHARNFILLGSTTYYNGTVRISGTCSISSMIAGNEVVSSVPLNIQSDLVSIDDNISVKGSTIDIAEFYINDKKIHLIDGKFIVNLNVANTDKLVFKWKTVFGNVITEEYTIDKMYIAPSGKTSHYSVIDIKENIELIVNEKYNLYEYINIYDKEDGKNNYQKLEIDDSKLNISKCGTYSVTINVIDRDGLKTSRTINVLVKEKYTLGDVDQNGKIEAQDAVMILKYVAHNIELTDEQLLAANTTKDADGKVDSQDAVQILKYVAHNITEF